MNIEKIMKRANELYLQAKIDAGLDAAYLAPEQLPRIQSDQVKCIAAAITEEVNAELDALRMK